MTRITFERWRVASRRPATIVLCALLSAVLAYAAFLRLDVLFARYGPLTHPGWAVALEGSVRAARAAVAPHGWRWSKVDQPYVGGDPINYLRFAREMRHFYQAHVREPVFLAATRLFLRLTDDQDVAVSFASATFSVLAVFGTYLLGSAVASRWVGLAAAAALAVEREVVGWSPDGWRDDAFTAVVCLSAWSILRFRRRPTWRSAVLAGALAGAACLTRITAASFLLPAFALTALPDGRAVSRRNMMQTALALAVMLAVTAPYLVNCYLAYGDPLYSINAHTAFYRFRLGIPPEQDQGALAFIGERFGSRPVAATDTALRGLFVYPFWNKWSGWDAWIPHVGPTLSWLSVAGLFAWLWQPVGRLTLTMLVMSLVPYMLTWPVAGGGEWRFTMHAYPFYLVAAFAVIEPAMRSLRDLLPARLRAPGSGRSLLRRTAAPAMALATLAAGAVLGHSWIPTLVVREALRAGEATTIGTGPHDDVFFQDGWSDPVTTGAVAARFALSSQAGVCVPLPEPRPYRLAIRMDPVPSEDAPRQRVHLFLDRQPIAVFPLTWDPGRVGNYTIDIPPSLANRGCAYLAFVADRLQPAGRAASLYPGIASSQPVAFRLWYVRVTPL
jgi:hypothetical protein